MPKANAFAAVFVASHAFVTGAPGLQAASTPLSDPVARRHRAAFREAHTFIKSRDYGNAAALLEKNLREYSNAPMADYDHAWFAICLAHLGRYSDLPKHYEIIQTKYRGFYRDDVTGFGRI